MRRLLGTIALLLLLVTGCARLEPSVTPETTATTPSPTATTPAPSSSPSPETGEETTPEPEPPFELPLGEELPEGFDPQDFLNEDGTFDYEEFLQWLEEQGVEPTATPTQLDCTAFVEWCHYHPLVGNCPWSTSYGAYLCDSRHYDFAGGCEYRLTAGAYLCREESGW